MALKKKDKEIKGDKAKHVHIQDIPLKYFQKTNGNKSREYKNELIRMMATLRRTNERVQYSSQISAFNIKSITRKLGFNPSPPEVFRSIEDFVYHYENYCYRAFAFREKLFQFINAILPLGYKEKDVRLKHLAVNPMIKQAKLLSIIEKFDKDRTLSSIIEDRNSLTHRLYYGSYFDHYLRPKERISIKNKSENDRKRWFWDWKNEIEKRADMANKFSYAISKLNHEITPKIIAYKNSLKRK